MDYLFFTRLALWEDSSVIRKDEKRRLTNWVLCRKDIEPIVGHGSVNQIFIITTDTEKLVIRLNDDRGFDEFVKEKWCIEQATAKGVPGPKVLKLGELGEYSYMVQTFLEGVVGSQGK